MKDQFGNYVVQKVLETCDDQNLELILSRIKVHLNTLKRYTYGKHIVSRVEKLIATGGKYPFISLKISIYIYFLASLISHSCQLMNPNFLTAERRIGLLSSLTS